MKSMVTRTIAGAMSNPNGDGPAAFDLDMLKAPPITTFKTKAMWTEGVKTFTGIFLQALLADLARLSIRRETGISNSVHERKIDLAAHSN